MSIKYIANAIHIEKNYGFDINIFFSILGAPIIFSRIVTQRLIKISFLVILPIFFIILSIITESYY